VELRLNTVKENITLYGTWTQIKYTVTFNVAGGTPAGIFQSVPHGSAATRPANPTRTDYSFDDWYTATDFAAKWNFGSIVTADITLYAKWKPLTIAALLANIGLDAEENSTSANYTLPSGSETYNIAVNLTTASSPASVVIDGGNRVVTGSANSFTIGSGVTITLKNITFKTLPFYVSAGGKLVLDNGAVVTENVETGITVYGESTAAKGTLEMKAGSSVTGNGDAGVCIEGTGVFTMSGGVLSGNTADRGCVRIEGTGVFTMDGGTISDNINVVIGGVGIWGAGAIFTINAGIIRDNTSQYYGGGVGLWGAGAIFTMNGGTISGNHAPNGGGVFINGSVFTMNGGEIYGNTAQTAGGVFLYAGSTLAGNPQIGGTNPGTGRGWIHGNSPNDRN
jgi:uncharacterized repeat protein (TIGR02543 family)